MFQYTDLQTDLVYFSKFFALRFPEIFSVSKTNLEANGIEVRTLGGCFNIWIRDFAPVQVSENLIQFSYKGYSANGVDVGYDQYPWLQIPQKCFDELNVFKKILPCPIVLDGGGIIRSRTKSVITQKVFLDNPGMTEEAVIKGLQNILQTDIIIIPSEPGDQLGHADGICKFIDEQTILVNDYRTNKSLGDEWATYANEVEAIFTAAGLVIVRMPYGYENCPQPEEKEFYEKYPLADDLNPCIGYAINFLLTKSTILAPVFGGDLLEKDEQAISTLRKWYPCHSVVAINCRELSMEGGALNCVSANYIKWQ